MFNPNAHNPAALRKNVQEIVNSYAKPAGKGTRRQMFLGYPLGITGRVLEILQEMHKVYERSLGNGNFSWLKGNTLEILISKTIWAGSSVIPIVF